MELFKYNKGLNVVFVAVLVIVAIGPIWILTKLPSSAILLRVSFLLGILFILTLALKGFWRLFDIVIVSDYSIIRRSLLREIEIPWNRVAKVEIYTPWFEDVGLRIISENGEKIVVTKLLRGFEVFCRKVRGYVPERTHGIIIVDPEI